MSWRIVSVTSLSKLDYKLDYLVIRNKEGITRIHLSEISILILESTAISLTAYLLRELDRRKIDVIFCDEKRLPYAMFSSLYGSHDTALCYRQQINWSDEIKDSVWAAIIRRKIYSQYSLLSESEVAERELLLSYIEQVQPGDVTNREGHAAKVYFNALFGQEYSRTSDNAINSCLNYGYSLLLSATAREIIAAGYCTQLGIFHANRFNRFNLASDLMEPFRVFVDAKVKDLQPGLFEKEQKRQLIAVLNTQLDIAGKKQFLLIALRIFVKSALDALSHENLNEICFPDYNI